MDSDRPTIIAHDIPAHMGPPTRASGSRPPTVVNVVSVKNVVTSLSKTLVFGWIIANVACYLGLTTRGGTVGVGRATTSAVVYSSIAILVSDFFLTKILMTI